MAFDWSDYLDLARRLADQRDEASARTAISRAYYFVFHVALTHAKRESFIPLHGEGTHLQLWRFYSESAGETPAKLAAIGIRLKSLRVQADYRPDFPRVMQEAVKAIGLAAEFATLLQGGATRIPGSGPISP